MRMMQMEDGILGQNLGYNSCPYLSSFYPEIWRLKSSFRRDWRYLNTWLRKFCPKMPSSCSDMNVVLEFTEKDIVWNTIMLGESNTNKTQRHELYATGETSYRLQTTDSWRRIKTEGIRPLTLTKRASCIGHNRSLIQNSEFATQGQW